MPSGDRGTDYYAWRMLATVATIVAIAWVIVAMVTDSAIQWAIAAVTILTAIVNLENVRRRSRP